MQRRIDIDWDDPIKYGDQSIVGLVRIVQGESCTEMEEIGRCIIEVSSSESGLQKGLRAAPGRSYLPPEMAEEGVEEAVYDIAQAYLYGLNAKPHIYLWTNVS